MNFLFSTTIGRVTFLVRYLVVNAILVLAADFILDVDLSNVWSLVAFPGCITFAGFDDLLPYAGVVILLTLPGFYYYMHFGVIARMRDIGLSAWHAAFMILPLLCLTITVLTLQKELPWTDLAFGSVSLWTIIYYTMFGVSLIYMFLLFLTPEGFFSQGNVIQAFICELESGRSLLLFRCIALVTVLCLIGGLYNFGPVSLGTWYFGGINSGLKDSQSMDNAQLARQISRGEGFTTKFLRPYALIQMQNYAASQGEKTGQSPKLFPPDRFPQGTPRTLPDTYNAPGYPYVLAGWFKLARADFNQSPESIRTRLMFIADHLVAPLNTIFMLLTAVLVFLLGLRLFDERVAWISILSFLFTDLVWRYTLTALSTSMLMFLVTAVIYCALEIFSIGEDCAKDEDHSFGKAWLWALLLSLLMAAACLTRFELLILIVPFFLLFILMPKASYSLSAVTAVLVVLAVAPWFWHMYQISGNPLGSNTTLLLYGDPGYEGDHIYRAASLPSYDSLLKNVIKKECDGVDWHFKHLWDLLGFNPFLILFAASFLHEFRQIRVRVLQWLITGCAAVLIFINSLTVTQPEALGASNVLILFLPFMVVIGTAYLFILITRLDLRIELLNIVIVVFLLVVSALPLTLTLTTPNGQYFSFPPYMPDTIKRVSVWAQPDEFVTSDMPWASAWYADHSSLWLPESMADFEHIHDTICPTGILFMTPETLKLPADSLVSGENKEWFCLITGVNIPSSFPFHANFRTPPGSIDYYFWSDRPRWQQ